jgi:uncharacterized protein YciI
MKRILILLFLPFLAFLHWAGKPASGIVAHSPADTPRMKQFWLVQLLRGTNRTHDSATAKALQAAHIANIERLHKEGYIIMAGPMGYDKDWRGIFIMDAKDSATAASLVNSDPAVKAGRLRFELHPWWFQTGTYIFK